MIKKILEDANRYDDVKNILNNIIKDNQYSYPVNAFGDDYGRIKYRVDGNAVRKEASILLQLIDEEKEINEKSRDNISNLFRYVRSQYDMLLHNYAVYISYKKDPDVDIDIIRSWGILDSLISCFDYVDDNWYIPNGWRKVID